MSAGPKISQGAVSARTAFYDRLAEYRLAYAAYFNHADQISDDQIEESETTTQLSEEHDRTKLALLTQPAGTPAQLAMKLEVIMHETDFDLYHAFDEVMAALLKDPRKLLPGLSS